MTTDREILEFAAKAMGLIHVDYTGSDYDGRSGLVLVDSVGRHQRDWNPLTSSADCAAMCAKLSIDTVWFRDMVECLNDPADNDRFGAIYSQFNNDREAAWRYAATMVAAKIEGMK